MLENLLKVLRSPLILLGLVLFIISLFFGTQPSYLYYLTVAQLIYTPIMVEHIVKLHNWEKLIIATGMLSVSILTVEVTPELANIAAGMYVLATFVIAKKGIERFLHRGFTNKAEIVIDIGVIYIAIGGLWFLAYIAGIDTGFPPIINWLTSIHFHYSAFLLCISLGLIGRLTQGRLYNFIAVIFVTGPMLVALGITFSRILEIVSVILYILAIYALFFMLFRIRMPFLQALSIRLTIASLCFTILWSLLYAYGNLTEKTIVTIPDMLHFHGFYNCVIFGLFTIVGWSIKVPETKQPPYSFPVSGIRGKLNEVGEGFPGLVDSLADFVDCSTLPRSITHFYEHTNQYRLFASVTWKPWFKPFAFIYQGISKKIGQLNLPYSSHRVEMTGTIHSVDNSLDGREKPRVWKRQIEDETVFVAIYSKHTSNDKTYMNIALPLPFSTMVGILELSEQHGELHIKSNGTGDSGTYLAIGNYVMKLPLHEYFIITEEAGDLIATHIMTIFGLHFLHIDYKIVLKLQKE
ncbi:YndJ family protein [Lysinibacillus sp. 54212]|uniref:YndJ family protein n=1 Tax=Lysinibacillus sp. 54212 TaxID=3119829 RepID=UPI002FCBDCE5